MTISRFVKSLFDETVAVLISKVVVTHRAGGTGTWASPTGTTDIVLAALGSHFVISAEKRLLNLELSVGANECSSDRSQHEKKIELDIGR
jgi:hypothetical protein